MTSRTRPLRPCLPAVVPAILAAGLVGLSVPGEEGHPRSSAPPVREIVNSVGMKLVRVPAGTFTMGSPRTEKGRGDDEEPHVAEITRPFYLGIHEVTQEQYARIMDASPSWFSASGGGRAQVKGRDTRDFPVERISWHDAVAFCKGLSAMKEEKEAGRTYRLPSEAEWEYACREGGAAKTPFHFGDTLTSDRANFDGRYPYGSDTEGPFLGRTTRVGSYRPNALGLYDLHGNVWEWCADWYDPDYYARSPRKAPKGPATGTSRVLRGGFWDSDGRYCRAADRYQAVPGNLGYDIGFRVVCVPRTP